MLVRARRDEIDPERVAEHFKELAGYDVSEERLINNIEHFMSLLREEGLYG